MLTVCHAKYLSIAHWPAIKQITPYHAGTLHIAAQQPVSTLLKTNLQAASMPQCCCQGCLHLGAVRLLSGSTDGRRNKLLEVPQPKGLVTSQQPHVTAHFPLCPATGQARISRASQMHLTIQIAVVDQSRLDCISEWRHICAYAWKAQHASWTAVMMTGNWSVIAMAC